MSISTKRVAFIGQTEYFRCHYETDLDADCTVFEKHLVWDAPSSWYDDLLEFNADINIFFRGDLVPLPVVEALKGLRVSYSTEPFPKLLNDGGFDYTLDSLGRFEQFSRIQKYPFEYVLHYDEASKSFLENQGFELSGYVPLPIATEAYRPVEAPRARDVLFLGRSTAHRERHLGQLKLDFDTFHIAADRHGGISPGGGPSCEGRPLPGPLHRASGTPPRAAQARFRYLPYRARLAAPRS